jgi:malic enzyme
MAIPIGKLALYTAGSGIHPALTLPVSLDVGTDNPALLADPLYLGYRAPRLRGAAYDALLEAFIRGVEEVWPGAIVQFEDFKQQNALRLLDRYQHRLACFNDDIQGTAAVVVAGVLTGLRANGQQLADARILLAGAGAAGVGIARLLTLAMREDGLTESHVRDTIRLVDTHGLVHAGRTDLDPAKAALAAPAAEGATPTLLETLIAHRPTVLVGTTGTAGTFDQALIDAMNERVDPAIRPIVMPLSNPTSKAEATPADILAWTRGRALVATGSPFPAVTMDGVTHEVGQANNVFVFPGVGLGAIVAEARTITDRMFLLAARELTEAVTPERLASGALYPAVHDLRAVSRRVAIAVATEAGSLADPVAAVDAAMWWPDYVPYVRVLPRADDRAQAEG